MHPAIQGQVLFDRELYDPIGTFRLGRMLLGNGHDFGPAVYRAPRGGEDDGHVREPPHFLQQCDRPQQIALDVELGILTRGFRNRGRREVEHRLHADERVAQIPGIGEIALAPFELRMIRNDLHPIAVRQFQDSHRPAIRQQGSGEIRPDEPASAYDQSLRRHALPSSLPNPPVPVDVTWASWVRSRGHGHVHGHDHGWAGYAPRPLRRPPGCGSSSRA